MLSIEIINHSNNPNPFYQTTGSAGMDLQAFLPKDIKLKPLQRALIPTGLFMAIPNGYEGQIRPRSGLALNFGLTVLNSVGTIDADYRGEIKVLLINLSDRDYIIKSGDRIAQLVIAPCLQANWINVEVLTETNRNAGGFGSTGQ